MKGDRVRVGLVGLALGFSLSRIGFSSWDAVHGMFTFSDLRLFGAFALAVVVLGAGWPILARVSDPAPAWPARPVHPGSIAGGVVFGIGWALSGACPAVALVQLGEGQLAAVFTLAGIFVGNYACGVVRERWLSWSAASCIED